MTRKSISIPGFAHSSPVPSASVKNGIITAGGMSGVDPETGILPPTLDEQCSNVFRHMRAVMEQAGGSVEDIIKVEVWLPSLADKEALNSQWLDMFPDAQSRPTRQAFPGALDFGAGILIVCNLLGVIDHD